MSRTVSRAVAARKSCTRGLAVASLAPDQFTAPSVAGTLSRTVRRAVAGKPGFLIGNTVASPVFRKAVCIQSVTVITGSGPNGWNSVVLNIAGVGVNRKGKSYSSEKVAAPHFGKNGSWEKRSKMIYNRMGELGDWKK